MLSVAFSPTAAPSRHRRGRHRPPVGHGVFAPARCASRRAVGRGVNRLQQRRPDTCRVGLRRDKSGLGRRTGGAHCPAQSFGAAHGHRVQPTTGTPSPLAATDGVRLWAVPCVATLSPCAGRRSRRERGVQPRQARPCLRARPDRLWDVASGAELGGSRSPARARSEHRVRRRRNHRLRWDDGLVRLAVLQDRRPAQRPPCAWSDPRRQL